MDFSTEDASDLPSVPLRCAGVRSNHRSSAVSEGGRVFFSESQYADSPFLVRVTFDTVAFIHRGSHVVERRFVFPARVLHAVLVNFASNVSSVSSLSAAQSSSGAKRQRKTPLKPKKHPHLCVLVRSDCLNVYTAAGEVFEVALPFQANKLFPMERGRGLLLQRSPAVQIPNTPSKRPQGAAAAVLSRKNRRASTSNRGDGDRYNYTSGVNGEATRPRYFTLRHPLDEVKPVALSGKEVPTKKGKPVEIFLADSAFEAVNVLDDGVSLVLVVFHKWDQRFNVFRLNAMESNGSLIPQIRVVDGPTWTKYRINNELEEFRVRIMPDWIAAPLWKSPRLGASTSKSTLLSAISSPPLVVGSSPVTPSLIPSLLSPPGEVTKAAFIASDIDDLPLLCMMDKDSGTLLLRPLSRKSTSKTFDGGSIETTSFRILQCRDAVPIRQQDYCWSSKRGTCYQGNYDRNYADILVLQMDGALVLHRAHHPFCRIVLPSAGWNATSDAFPVENKSDVVRLVGNVQLNSVDAGIAYEILFPDLCGASSGKIWRCEHPLKIVNSPLLQQVFEVLDYVVPSPHVSTFKAQVCCRALQKAQSETESDGSVGGECEWQAFRDCMTDLLAVQNCDGRNERHSSVVAESVTNGENLGAGIGQSCFDELCQSEYHDLYQYEHAMLFATMKLPPVQPSDRGCGSQRLNGVQNGKDEGPRFSAMQQYVEDMFAGLHLLCEELKLSIALLRPRLLLANLLLDVAVHLGLDPFIAYYKEDNCVLKGQTGVHYVLKVPQRTQEEELLCFASYGCVPDMIQWVKYKMTSKTHEIRKFPVLLDILRHRHQQLNSGEKVRQYEGPLQRTLAICRIYELLFPIPEESLPHTPTPHPDQSQDRSAFKLMVFLTQDPVGTTLSLDDLPVGLSFPIAEAVRHVKHEPPHYITDDMCAFIGREDLSITNAGNISIHADSTHTIQNQHDPTDKRDDTTTDNADDNHHESDGLEEIIIRSQPLFSADQRMKEVARLLRSSRPLCLKLEKQPDLSDMDYAQQQQARLLLLCKRSMSLSVARGMVTLGSFDVSTAQTQVWQLRVPPIPLTGRKPPTNAIVELDLSGYAKELTYWPQFHNGCATGLRLPAHDLSGVINRHWIKYHRPSVSGISQRNSATSTGNRQPSTASSTDAAGRSLEEAYASHAGLLLGIGLRGHLKCLSMADVYNYLSLSNEFVTVAIMLGMASTAAHCRCKRKQQTAMDSSSSITATTKLQNESSTPSTFRENAQEELPPLETDHLFSGFPELSSSDKTPLLGTGLELALERSVSKMLCLHVPSLLPPPFAGFSVPASTQTAALLGLGILYQGSGYRLMTELLLNEIARSPSSAQFVGNNSNTGLSTASFDQLEGYSLAAGMALGLVVLGRGHPTTGDPGLADLKLEEKLHRYIVGGAQQYRDTNAAGSCLYRGRRWQAFGSGGSLNSGVNVSSTGNGSSNHRNGTAPGAGRDAKNAHDRSNMRGGGEHVNIGVTACGSALALAFMYMHTGNKAVAAQLQIPDTLILLDYVRPDILLVRTLAKNLVLWNEISPTSQWIEQREVPAQLLHAYRSLQPRNNDSGQEHSRAGYLNGLPPHADLHSICESYANIVAGACMSIGLRFAGTGNVSARATLREYVLHFRELRTKASFSSTSMILRGSSNVVAAATERATVERCLAVCAQALALVDAGTGNVETLSLLRSVTLRQRVDAAMTYGNHMALSMAIGLLFLGGGRATVSRSKEAIAALVISLYPMAPMNTADNKYHLQAFRHLYVLAVDTSRLLETLDVNTQTICAVQLHVDFLSDYDKQYVDCAQISQPKTQVMHTPCLLPDITSIKRLAIRDPKFYPVEILTSASPTIDTVHSTSDGEVRTANALRLELLRSTNVVFLKRRHQKDIGSSAFTSELHLLNNMSTGAPGGRNEDDRLLHRFQSYFAASNSTDDDECECGDDELDQLAVADWGSSWWASHLSPRALQRVREEVQLLLPPFLNALHALFRLQQVPQLLCTTEVVALSQYCGYCRLDSPPFEDLPLSISSPEVTKSCKKDTSLVDFGVWLSNQTEEALRALWHRCPLAITSLASARVQLLVEATPSTTTTSSAALKVQSKLDAFLVAVVAQYFGGPSASSQTVSGLQQIVDKDWKAKFQRVLAACSQVQPQLTDAIPSLARFQLRAFLEQNELTEAEKTFWLKLVSFFLFSN